MKPPLLLSFTVIGFLLIAVLALFVGARPATAQAGSPLHPTFPLLDADGKHVLESGNPVSTMQTCGACHDTAFIAQHSFHVDAGLSELSAPGSIKAGHAWDISPGNFGKWNPLTYRYLSPTGDGIIDLTTPEWLQVYGARHVGGGPAEYARDGSRLLDLPVVPGDPQTTMIDPQTGEPVPWDWQESGTVEMNCFLCHTAAPNNAARIAALQTGEFAWANSATLVGTGVIEQVGGRWESCQVTSDALSFPEPAQFGGWKWNAAAFNPDGTLIENVITIQDPTSENCGQCHGIVHVNAQIPLTVNSCDSGAWSTTTTGQIFSPQQLSNSGLNLADKETLTRSWDVHAERVLECTNCHYSLNNPVYYRESAESQPEHLTFDPRRLDLGEYLYRPLHQFAKGQSAQSALAPELDNTLRRCESCHNIAATHNWLPYRERHMAELSCETCHIPKIYGPALQSIDWTALQGDGSPRKTYRGIEGGGNLSANTLIAGYEPALLPRQNSDGSTSLAPYNLITAWFWVYGDPPRPVPLRFLQAAWLDESGYRPEILAAFDRDSSGALEDNELVIDSEAKKALIAAQLEAAGLENPRIVGEIQPYSINHNVASGEWATRDCRTCHGEESRLYRPIPLADRTPGGVRPTFVGTSASDDTVFTTDTGELAYRAQPHGDGLYIFGHDAVYWIDWLGVTIFLGTLVGVSAHGGLRCLTARRRIPRDPVLRKEYMYSVYERQWHWLQTVVILGLVFTGLIIHKPDKFGIFSFDYVVQVHNVLAFILVINAALAAFYHLASGEIRQFLPQPHGFFDQAFAQAKFYLRGIFRGEKHPFEKTRDKKLNPLQQITYLAILNVLLPLQVITGILMWGAQQWPNLAASLGGLPFLAPLHTLVAWLFASFVVLHVYLTTTGHRPLAGIKSMISGWDEVEVHSASPTKPQEETLT